MDAVQKALRVAKAEGGGSDGGGVDTGVASTSTTPPTTTATTAPTDYTTFLNNLYQQQFNRTPDAAGLDYWTNQLNSGAMDLNAVQNSIASSPEATRSAFLDAYKTQLNRTPDQSGLSYWQNQVANGTLSLDQALKAIGASPEATKDDFTAAYKQYLGREPDAAGLSYWQNQVANGTMTLQEALNAIAMSAEATGSGGAAGAAGGGSGAGGSNQYELPDNSLRLIYTPPPYKDYGATQAAYRVASGLENLPDGFFTYSPIAERPPIDFNQSRDGTNFDLIKKGLDSKNTNWTQQQTQQYSDAIAKAYQNIFGRDADAEGLAYWNDQLKNGSMSYNDILNALKASPEATKAPLTTAYQDYFGRAPDTEGLNYWQNQIATGKMTLADTLNALKQSPEGAISAAYTDYLGRTPDASGMDYWKARVASGEMTVDQVINAIANSPEAIKYTSTFKSGGAVKGYASGGSIYDDLVKAAYKDFLGRDPDQSGMDYWVKDLESGNLSVNDFEKAFKSAGYEDEIANVYRQAFNRDPDEEGRNYWRNQLDNGDISLENFVKSVQASQEYSPYKFSTRQPGAQYDIDIGNVERIPKLGAVKPLVNVRDDYANSELARLRQELEALKNSGGNGRSDNGGGGGTGGGGDGTAGGLGDTAGGGGYGSAPGNSDSASGSPAGDGGGPMGLASGGTAGNNAINNALRLLKADRH